MLETGFTPAAGTASHLRCLGGQALRLPVRQARRLSRPLAQRQIRKGILRQAHVVVNQRKTF